VIVLVTLIVLGLLFVFFRYTPLGLAMRAAAQNPQMARLVGVRVDWMLALGWGTGALDRSRRRHHDRAYRVPRSQHDAGILLYAFASALVGGISSPARRRAGGFVGVSASSRTSREGTYISMVGNGEKLTVALIIVSSWSVNPSGLFGRAVVQESLRHAASRS
jgi:branched-chain amino acid transport system permease protein